MMMKMNPLEVRKILSKNILADGFEPVLDLEKSHGSWLVDQRDGNEYLDLFTMYASGSIGFNHPYVLENKEQLLKASLFKPTLSDIYSVQYADFVNVFNAVAIPAYLKKTFFIEGGSLAVENALKVAFDWKKRKNLDKGVDVDDLKVLYFKEAFHGRSGYTLSLTNTSDPRKTMYFPKFDWPKIINPKLEFPLTDQGISDTKENEDLAVKQIKMAIENNPDQISCLIIEPIQGEGGDNHFRCRFFEKLRELADSYDFLLIYDEVQTGVGITGKMWAHQHFVPSICPCDTTIKKAPLPDILAFGKKSQVCGILCGDRIDEVERNAFVESSRINSTFGGNLVDMVRFKIILEVIEKEQLLDSVVKSGNYLIEGLNNLASTFPGLVSNVRGKGLFCAFDVPSDTERDKLIKSLYENNVMILGSGDKSIRFRPNLNIKHEEIDFGLDALNKSLKSLLK